MNDEESQIHVPASFVALFVEPGRIKPSAPRAHITQRYEFCEDLAQLLSERAQDIRVDLGITGHDVLQRMQAGLHAGAAGVDEREAQWVFTRLVELLGWPP